MLANIPVFCLLCSCLIVLSACNGSEAEEPTNTAVAAPMKEAIIGTWEMIELEVEAPTFEGSDSTFVRFIHEADWVRVYGVNPGRTTFSADEKLVRRNLLVGSDTPVITHGLWRFSGDSLMIIEPNTTQHFVANMTPAQDQFELKGLIDWDSDGETDDNYRARYRLVGKTQEAEGK